MATSPPLSKRRLSRLLRERREEIGYTVDQVAEAAQERGAERWSGSKVSRMERDEWTRPKVEDIELLAEIYGVTNAEQHAEYIRLAREARQKGWWYPYADVIGRGTLTGLEPGASRIRAVGVSLIPGLLQTEDYMRTVIRGGGISDPAEIDRRVEVRLLRQRVLAHATPPVYWAIIDEAALRKGGVSRHQLQHLIDVQGPRLRVQILPDSAGPHSAACGFTMLDFEGDTGLVYTETPVSHDVDSDPGKLAEWELVYQYVSASALSVEESEEHLRGLIESHE